MTAITKLIIGLGNPGVTYKNNRHNTGFMVLDVLAESAGISWTTNKKIVSKIAQYDPFIFLVKPQTFMNESGRAVLKAIRFYSLEPADLIVVHDDVDLEFGQIRLSHESSSAGHRGVQDIIDKLGTKDFLRLRVGIGRPVSDFESVEKYVLEDFTAEELASVAKLGVEHLLSSLKI